MDVSETATMRRFRVTTTGVAALCIAYVAAAVAVAPTTYFEMLTEYTLKKYSLAIPVFAFFGMAGIAVLSRPSSPLTFVLEKSRVRGKGVLLTTGMFILGAAAFSTLKHVTPIYVPFFADPFLADLDAAIHMGDPWKGTHAIFPHVLEPALFVLYGPVWFVQMVGMILVAAFTSDHARRARYLLSFLLVAIVLGNVVRILGSSAGPIFFERIVGDPRFADLISGLDTTGSGRGMIATSNYLYSSYAHDRTVFGTGIAAMPSLHVAVAFLNALFLSQFGRLYRYWGLFYFAAIMFGSVYFGWHYAIDGYLAILGTVVIWRYVGRFVGEEVISLSHKTGKSGVPFDSIKGEPL
ncbi:hypothetical protein X731_30695 [Mesorhizobium sp. L2C054A000]|nr:hypothetical protein X731_30695 [Mesorhizobium sp. L2C054A000]